MMLVIGREARHVDRWGQRRWPSIRSRGARPTTVHPFESA